MGGSVAGGGHLLPGTQHKERGACGEAACAVMGGHLHQLYYTGGLQALQYISTLHQTVCAVQCKAKAQAVSILAFLIFFILLLRRSMHGGHLTQHATLLCWYFGHKHSTAVHHGSTPWQYTTALILRYNRIVYLRNGNVGTVMVALHTCANASSHSAIRPGSRYWSAACMTPHVCTHGTVCQVSKHQVKLAGVPYAAPCSTRWLVAARSA